MFNGSSMLFVLKKSNVEIKGIDGLIEKIYVFLIFNFFCCDKVMFINMDCLLDIIYYVICNYYDFVMFRVKLFILN